MRVLMLGWEFPPFISGGLGTACYGLTKAMSGIGTDIMFVLPRPVATPFSTHVRLVSPREGSPLAAPISEYRLDEFDRVTFRTVNANLTPYQTPEEYVPARAQKPAKDQREAASDAAAASAKPARSGAGATGANYAGGLLPEGQRYALPA